MTPAEMLAEHDALVETHRDVMQERELLLARARRGDAEAVTALVRNAAKARVLKRMAEDLFRRVSGIEGRCADA